MIRAQSNIQVDQFKIRKCLNILPLPIQSVCRTLISKRILLQIQLMIRLRIVPLICFNDLSNDLLPFRIEVGFLDFSRNFDGSGMLSW